MSKSLIYSANTQAQTVAVGGVINFGDIVRRYGCNLAMSGGNVIANGQGYYDIDTNFTVVAGGAGVVTITLYADGVAIPGATASGSAASGASVSIAIPAVIRERCCKDTVITAVLTGVGSSISNAAIKVVKE